MDPSACYQEMLEAAKSGDRDRAKERASDLRRWLDRGGFVPVGYDLHVVNVRVGRVLCGYF